VGLNREELIGFHCWDQRVLDFCDSRTCGTVLQDTCGTSARPGHCEECIQCTRNLRMSNGTGTTCSQDEKDNFCDSACTPTIDCMTQLEDRCGSDRKKGSFQCAMCVGGAVTSGVLGNLCNATQQQFTVTEKDFCSNQGCIPQLADACPTRGSCYDCASCALKLRQQTHCREKDEDLFCKAHSRAPVPKPMSCMAALTKFCEADRKMGEFECIQCTGEHKAQLPHCSDTLLTEFCKGSARDSCYPALSDSCNSTTGNCAECAACVDGVMKKHGGNGSSWCDEATRSDFCSQHPQISP
jgi:hypothetical protein